MTIWNISLTKVQKVPMMTESTICYEMKILFWSSDPCSTGHWTVRYGSIKQISLKLSITRLRYAELFLQSNKKTNQISNFMWKGMKSFNYSKNNQKTLDISKAGEARCQYHQFTYFDDRKWCIYWSLNAMLCAVGCTTCIHSFWQASLNYLTNQSKALVVWIGH